MTRHFAATALTFALFACSNEQAPSNATIAVDNGVAASGTVAASPAPASAENTDVAEPAKTNVLALEGLGDLAIGKPVPSGSSWAVRGAQASDQCLTLSSPDFPGVYAIVEDGAVRRITAGQRSTVKLAEGLGVGATEAQVKKWFPSFRVEPHKYEAAPAKYLTAPNAPGGDSALRFEIGSDGKVSLIHVGTMPVLAYVEGCA
ncbi:MAG: hypothetical protein ABI617_06750 [Sphingomicrobium sp.]